MLKLLFDNPVLMIDVGNNRLAKKNMFDLKIVPIAAYIEISLKNEPLDTFPFPFPFPL